MISGRDTTGQRLPGDSVPAENKPTNRLRHPEFHGRIGVASRDITPPLGIHARTWGSATHDVAEGVHRPLLASCLLFRDPAGKTEQVLITLDALVFWPLAAEKIRSVVQARFGLRREQLIFHPSHSHSTPFLAKRHIDRPGGDLIEPYLESIPRICCELIEQARAGACEAVLSWAYGRCGLAFNRDAVDSATGRDICGLNLLEAADDTVLVGRVTDRSGKIIATVVNYACHPVSLGGGNRLLSPDYVGAMRELVQQETGGALCLFFHGASGDMTPRRSYEPQVEAAEQNGRELGFAALSVLASMFPPGQQLEYKGIEESGTPLGVWRLESKDSVNEKLSAQLVSATLQVRDMPTREQIKAQLATATEHYEIERLERTLGRRELAGDDPQAQMPFTVWRLGDAFIVSTPAEPYSRFQQELRKAFPDSAIAVLNLSDGATTYLPKPASFARDVYQVRVALYEPDSLQTMTEEASAAIAAMS
jgi:hypothetical protein